MAQLGGICLPDAASARIRQGTLNALLEQMADALRHGLPPEIRVDEQQVLVPIVF